MWVLKVRELLWMSRFALGLFQPTTNSQYSIYSWINDVLIRRRYFYPQDHQCSSKKFVEKTLKPLKYTAYTRDGENSRDKAKPEKCLHDTADTYRELYPERGRWRYDEGESTQEKESSFRIESICQKTHFDRLKCWNHMFLFFFMNSQGCVLHSPRLNTDVDEIERSEPFHDIEEHDRLRDNHRNPRNTVGHMHSDTSAKTKRCPESYSARISETISCTEDKIWTWTDEG